MKKFLFLMAFFSISAYAQKVDYGHADSVRVMSLFGKAKSLERKTMANYMVFFGRQLKGIPYVAKTLEVNSEEHLVVNLRQLDCTTYVETVLALSRCMAMGKMSFANYCDQLRIIRYAKGIQSYATRKHYFTYWIQQSVEQGLVKDVQEPNPPYSAVQEVKASYMTTHLSQYPMLNGKPEWVGKIKAMEESVTGLRPRYIPTSSVDNSALLRSTVHDGDIIAIVTTKEGLEISHLGIAVWHKDGLHMLNASSIYHKVVEDGNLLKKYLLRQKSAVGIRTVRAIYGK